MNSYTLYDLSMNVDGKKFVLPYDVSEPDESILEKTRDLFTEEKVHYFLHEGRSRADMSAKYNRIRLPCLYEGGDGYYAYTFVLNVFRLKYNNNRRLYIKGKDEEVKDGQWMIAMYVECAIGALLEELIDIKVFPELIESLGLKKASEKY